VGAIPLRACSTLNAATFSNLIEHWKAVVEPPLDIKLHARLATGIAEVYGRELLRVER
jgi:hypothetical protein